MKPDTHLIHTGRPAPRDHECVNVPVYRASTILHADLAALEAASKGFETLRYGRFGTPTTFAFEEAVATIEGGWRSIAMSSGLAAITGTLLALLKTGDHLLMVDTVYGPTRKFCDEILAKFGIETTYYSPALSRDIEPFFRPNTRLVYAESPGSMTFEVQDIPAIASVAHAHGALVVLDNTWGVLNFQPFRHGVDVSLQACTKYIVGHADAMLGAITTTEQHWRGLKDAICTQGNSPGSEELFLGLRGVRTLAVRLRQHTASALRVAEWLSSRPEVDRVLYPALPSDPGHGLWKRDFTGACGLFGVILKPASRPGLEVMLNHYDHFKLGFSWGGFESLVVPTMGHAIVRTAESWAPKGPSLRYHVGLEDPEDLISDLEAGFQRLASS